MSRPYESPIREERTRKTRLALLDACEELLLEGPAEAVTLPAVAQRAGVSKPTAYSHFPDNDALMAGFIEHLRGRLGMDHATLAAIPPERLPEAVRQNYRQFDANGDLLRRLMSLPSYERVRLSRKVDRAAMAMPVWDLGVPEALLRERLGALYLFVTPASWRWLRDTWGLSPEAAASAAAWAMKELAACMSPTTKSVSTRKAKPRSTKTTTQRKRSKQ